MRITTGVALALLLSAPAAPAAAQPKASQHGVVAQTVNGTEITLEYDRPSARGRSIFGDILDYDVVWTPGANRATWIEFSTPVTVEGTALEAGRYGMWAVPHEDAPWEVIFVSEWDTHHSYFPMETEVARIRVEAKRGIHMETLAFYFPVVGPYTTTLVLHWGPHVLPLEIRVPE